LLGGFFWIRGYPYQSYLDHAPVIAAVSEKDPVGKEGIVPGDKIVSINDVATPTWEKAEEEYSKASQGANVKFAIEHGGAVQQLNVSAQTQKEADAFNWYTPDMAVIADVIAGQPAAKAGLKADDQVISVGGVKITSRTVFIAQMQKSKGAEQEI